MSFNLLQEAWIPIRRYSGARSVIRPSELVQTDDPPVAIESGRADLDAGLAQFLIGLLQTSRTPASHAEWSDAYSTPPSVETVDAWFGPLASAFELLGEGQRFMQDPGARNGPDTSIMELFPDFPSDNARTNNADLFQHRRHARPVSPAQAASMLFTLQASAGSGGRGHRTSMRGGGPMTCVLLGETLWQTCWLNVLDAQHVGSVPGKEDSGTDAFLWMREVPTSANGETLTPEHVSKMHHFWGMPRRLWLETNEDGLVVGYRTAPNGPNYGDFFTHPLTPYKRHKPDTPKLAVKLQPAGLPYRDWANITLGSEQVDIATVVHAYYTRERYQSQGDLRVWVSGYDMDKAKARNFYEAVSPVLSLPDEQDRERLRELSQMLVAASEYARSEATKQIKNALFERPKEAKGDLATDRRFWAATEPAFFDAVRTLRGALEDDARCDELRERWLGTCRDAARELFHSYVLSSGFVAKEARREAEAWNRLNRVLSPKAKGFRAKAGLAPLTKEVA